MTENEKRVMTRVRFADKYTLSYDQVKRLARLAYLARQLLGRLVAAGSYSPGPKLPLRLANARKRVVWCLKGCGYAGGVRWDDDGRPWFSSPTGDEEITVPD